MFVKFWKISKIAPGVEFLFTEAGTGNSLQNSCLKHVFGKLPERSATALNMKYTMDLAMYCR